MSDYFETIGLDLSAQTERGKARQAVLQGMAWNPTPTTLVSYSAANRVLLVMDEVTAVRLEKALGDRFVCYIAVPGDDDGLGARANAWRVDNLELVGYLGHFSARLGGDGERPETETDLGRMMGIANGLFDHVIDASETALISAPVPPPGYHHAGTDPGALDAAVAAVTELVGEFEKPRYFQYNPDICAHGRSGVAGCTLCIDACPTDAIISIGEQVEVNPHLCQGGGACAAVCPSGAMTYRYPPVVEQIEFLRKSLRELRERQGPAEVTLLIYDSEHGAEAVQEAAARLPEHVFPFMVEEIGSVGPDLLAAAIAHGAGDIWLLTPATVSAPVRASLEANLGFLDVILRAAGEKWQVRQLQTLDPLLSAPEPVATRETVATFAGVGGKRRILRTALTSLLEQGDSTAIVPLPEGSPLGQVLLNTDACTLCMGCVAVCPGSALEAGGETPALKFIESNCVQCGICVAACPESALTLEARFDPGDGATRSRVLKEEEPFRCIKCGKPFATRAMIDRMLDKLAGHWMFQKPEQRNRLRMCEDCRVADMFDAPDALP